MKKLINTSLLTLLFVLSLLYVTPVQAFDTFQVLTDSEVDSLLTTSMPQGYVMYIEAADIDMGGKIAGAVSGRFRIEYDTTAANNVIIDHVVGEDEDWHELDDCDCGGTCTDDTHLKNGWENYDHADYSKAGYYKDKDGIIKFKGTIVPGTTTDGTEIFKLQTGYIPNNNTKIPIVSAGSTEYKIPSIQINSSGNVVIYSIHANPGYLDMGGASIRLDQGN